MKHCEPVLLRTIELTYGMKGQEDAILVPADQIDKVLIRFLRHDVS